MSSGFQIGLAKHGAQKVTLSAGSGDECELVAVSVMSHVCAVRVESLPFASSFLLPPHLRVIMMKPEPPSPPAAPAEESSPTAPKPQA